MAFDMAQENNSGETFVETIPGDCGNRSGHQSIAAPWAPRPSIEKGGNLMNCIAMKGNVMVVVLLATAPSWAEQPKADPADVKALHELHRAHLAAFNNGDAQAVAAFYARDADRIDTRGQMTKGRAEIEKGAANFFARNKGVKLNASFGTLRFLTPDVAVADRTGEVTPAPEGGPSKVHATVIYVKRDGKWMITSVRLAAPFQPSQP
jgi:uncharacterized protein (TIGR02246 family)